MFAKMNVMDLFTIYLTFILVLIDYTVTGNNEEQDEILIEHVSSEDLGYNVWTEERQAPRRPLDPQTQYAKERHCQPPTPLEAVKSHNWRESTWSYMFSRYTLDGVELETWLKNQEVKQETKKEQQDDLFFDLLIPLAFPVFFAVFLTLCVCVIPILGAIAFHICELIWWLSTHAEVRRIGRRFLISKEQASRKRQRVLLTESQKKPPRSTFRMPKFFRIHPGEEIPPELEDTEPEEIEWEPNIVPSDEDQNDKFSDAGDSLSGLGSDTEEEDETETEINIKTGTGGRHPRGKHLDDSFTTL